MRLLFRSAVALGAIATFLHGSPAAAQQTVYTWNNPAGGNWSVGTNWLGGTPLSNTGAILAFGDPTPVSGGYTATNDLGLFSLNRLTFYGDALPGTATPITAATSTTGSNTLRFTTFNTIAPTIFQTGSGAAAISGAVEFVNDTSVGGLGHGVLSFTGSLAGAGRLTIDRPVLNPFGGGNYTVLAPTTSSGFSGGVTLANGNLVLAGSQSLGTGTFTVNAGANTVQFGTTTTSVANTVQLNGALILAGTNGGTFAGPVNGAGDILVATQTSTFSPAPTVAFTGANGFTGSLTVRPGGFNTATAAFSGSGTARFAEEYVAYTRGTIAVNNAAANVANRLNSAATLTLHGGTFSLNANSAAAATESLATLRTTGEATVAVSGAGSTSSGTTATVTFGNWDRQENSIALFTAPGLGSTAANAGRVVFTTNPGGAVGGTGLPGTTTQAVLPYAVANVGTTAPQHELVRYDTGTGRVVALTDGTTGIPVPSEYALNLYTMHGTASLANVKVSDTIGGLNGTTAVNALVLNSVNGFSGTTRFAASVAGAGTLQVTGGVVLATERPAGGGGSQYLTPGVIGVSTLAFGNQTGYFHTYSSTSFTGLAVTAEVTGTAGVVKGGNAQLVLTRANSFTGGLTVNNGAVVVTDEAALGSGALTLAGGGGISFGSPPVLTDGTASAFTLTRGVTLGASGGGLVTHVTDSTLTVSGQVTGSGSLIVGGGLVRLTNTANDYAGGTLVGPGTLAIGNNAVLGQSLAGLTLVNNSTLQADASFTLNRMILLSGVNNPLFATTVFTNGNNLTISGIITSPLGSTVATTTGTLLKAGTGTLTLRATNTYTGQTVVGDATPTVRIGNPAFAQTGGMLQLSGPDGAIPLTSSVTVNAGSVLALDYAFANSNRVGSVPVTLQGGQLWLLGLAGAATTESLGTVTVGGGVGTILLGQPTSGSVTLSLGGLAANGPAVAVIRGDDLGGTGPRFTRVQFAGAGPALVNGIIPFAVAGASASGQPTDFVTTVTNAAGFAEARLFTAYGSLFSPGATVTANQAGGTFVLPGATSLNALRLGAGGGVNLNGNTLTIGSATQAGAILAAGGANAGLTGGTIAFGTRAASVTTVNDLTITSDLTGTAGLAKAGPGTLTLSGSGAGLTGGVVVGEGTLRYGVFNALPTTAAITVNAGATVDFNNFVSTAVTVASINGFGAVVNNTGLTIAGTGASILGGPLSGAGGIFKSGTGQLTLSGDNSGYTGTFTIRDGLLRVETPTALGTGTAPLSIGSTLATATAGNGLAIGQFLTTFTRNIDVQPTAANSPAVINTASAGNVTVTSAINLNANVLRLVGPSFFSDPQNATANFTGTITGTGRLEIQQGLYRLSGNNTYSGGTTFVPPANGTNTGFIGVGHDSAFGTGPVSINTPGSTTQSVEVYLRADGGARTLANPVVFNGNFASLTVVGTNPLTLTGPIDFGGSSRTFDTANTGLTTLSGVLSNGGLVKGGAGTLVLTNAGSTATGTSAVTGGLLVVNGTLPAPVSVGIGGVSPPSRGGVLGGTGTVGGIQLDGGTVAPGGNPAAVGNGVGTLTSTGQLRSNFLAYGTLSFDLNGATPGTGHDQLVVGTPGQATIVEVGAPNGNGLTLQTRLGFDPTGATITLVNNVGTAAIDGNFAGLPEGTTFSIGEFGGVGYLATITYLGGTGNDIVLHSIQPVPEPGAVLLVAAAAALGVRVRRRAGHHQQRSASNSTMP